MWRLPRAYVATMCELRWCLCMLSMLLSTCHPSMVFTMKRSPLYRVGGRPNKVLRVKILTKVNYD